MYPVTPAMTRKWDAVNHGWHNIMREDPGEVFSPAKETWDKSERYCKSLMVCWSWSARLTSRCC